MSQTSCLLERLFPHPLPDGVSLADALVATTPPRTLDEITRELLPTSPAKASTLSGVPELTDQIHESIARFSRRRRRGAMLLGAAAGAVLGWGLFTGLHVENHLKHLRGQEKIAMQGTVLDNEIGTAASVAVGGLAVGMGYGVWRDRDIAHRRAAKYIARKGQEVTSWTLPVAGEEGVLITAQSTDALPDITDYRLASGRIMNGKGVVPFTDPASLADTPVIGDCAIPELDSTYKSLIDS